MASSVRDNYVQREMMLKAERNAWALGKIGRDHLDCSILIKKKEKK